MAPLICSRLLCEEAHFKSQDRPLSGLPIRKVECDSVPGVLLAVGLNRVRITPKEVDPVRHAAAATVADVHCPALVDGGQTLRTGRDMPYETYFLGGIAQTGTCYSSEGLPISSTPTPSEGGGTPC